MYCGFEYLKERKCFHTFEAHICPAALNFADEDEAEDFFEIVQSKIKPKKQKSDTLNLKQSALQSSQVSRVCVCVCVCR